MASLGLPHFHIFSHKRKIFGRTYTEHKTRVLIFSTTFFLKSFWEELSDILPYIYIGLQAKFPLFLPDFN